VLVVVERMTGERWPCAAMWRGAVSETAGISAMSMSPIDRIRDFFVQRFIEVSLHS
jgi:hypothetical protein